MPTGNTDLLKIALNLSKMKHGTMNSWWFSYKTKALEDVLVFKSTLIFTGTRDF